ncbi:hypothetical protein M9979_05955 [Sphingomonas sp. RP10(2022)]|uniref:Phage shock protein B n=1 Tax=Sphingomonas liriopis TaxID=2949094 RepID=A0A9X2HU42_9SPHN|nr:hypothetical protein [Sphingomonas liriopis]MCP3734421.1 hypothetical protein [Sphingomonas liriopis]
MSDLALMIPITAIAIGPVTWIANNWLRTKHGYPPLDYRSRRRRGAEAETDLEAERKIMLLTNENDKLTGQVGRLEERIAVLERIATDPAERTAREIEALRDR